MWMKGGLDLLLLFFSIAHVFLDGWSDCSFLSHSQLPTAAEHGANGSRLFPFLSSVDITMISFSSRYPAIRMTVIIYASCTFAFHHGRWIWWNKETLYDALEGNSSAAGGNVRDTRSFACFPYPPCGDDFHDSPYCSLRRTKLEIVPEYPKNTYSILLSPHNL